MRNGKSKTERALLCSYDFWDYKSPRPACKRVRYRMRRIAKAKGKRQARKEIMQAIS